jgi:very-short-patch-repair endonuclease
VTDDRLKGFFNRKRLERRRKELRRDGTAAKAVLWKHLQNRKLAGKKFRRQQIIGPFIVDFYCRECRLIVELDGAVQNAYWAAQYDSERTKFLEENGMLVLRFENGAVYENVQAVRDTIKESLLSRTIK